jgi:hypothetical protein
VASGRVSICFTEPDRTTLIADATVAIWAGRWWMYPAGAGSVTANPPRSWESWKAKAGFSSFRYYGANSFLNRALSPVFGGTPQSKLHTSILQANDDKSFGSANGGSNPDSPPSSVSFKVLKRRTQDSPSSQEAQAICTKTCTGACPRQIHDTLAPRQSRRGPDRSCLDAQHQVLPWPTPLKAIRNPRTDVAFSGRCVDGPFFEPPVEHKDVAEMHGEVRIQRPSNLRNPATPFVAPRHSVARND